MSKSSQSLAPNVRCQGEIMKKFYFAIVLSLVLVIALVAFSACDESNSEPKYYDVTVNSGDNFSYICSHKNAKEGDIIVVTVIADKYFEVDTVMANDVACILNSQGKYEFTMPAEKVTIDVKLKPTPDIDEDGILKWKMVHSQIAVVEEDNDTPYKTQTYTLDFGKSGIPNSVDADGEMIDVEIYSLNKDVIPDDAISGAKASEIVASIYATQANFTIDLTKIKVGTARIVVKNSNRVLVKTIEVVDYGQVTPENLYTEKVVVDMSELTGVYDDMRIWIYDNDYTQGSIYDDTQFKDFKYSADNTFEYEFKYTPDHEFAIAVGYKYFDEDRQMYLYKNFAIENIVIGGSSQSGYTGIISDPDIQGTYYISYTADGLTLTAKVKDN